MKLVSFCFLIYDKATIPGKKGWCMSIVALIYCSLKVYKEKYGNEGCQSSSLA